MSDRIDFHVVHQRYGLWITLRVFWREMQSIRRRRKIIRQLKRKAGAR